MEWNQKRVRETLQPFVETARMVRVNSRKPYSPAGGRKRKGAYIDSYCAIKVPGLNATFNCFVEKQGDEPSFSLRHAMTRGGYNIRPLAVFNEAELGNALRLWREIAQQANRPLARPILSRSSTPS